MRHLSFSIALAAAVTSFSAGSAASTQDKVDKVIIEPITITGCVVAGVEPNTYLLTNVATALPHAAAAPAPDRPVGTSGMAVPKPVGTTGIAGDTPVGTSGRAVTLPFYWLDSRDKLKPHVGHRVQVRGMLAGDVDKTEIKDKDGEMKIVRERVKEVKISDASPVAAATPKGEREGVKVKVDSVSMLSSNCR